MKHFGFPARAFIGWIRICRPGSVLGPQQQFLCAREAKLVEEGKLVLGIQKMTLDQVYSDGNIYIYILLEDKFKAVHGDAGQAGTLRTQKAKSKSPGKDKPGSGKKKY